MRLLRFAHIALLYPKAVQRSGGQRDGKEIQGERGDSPVATVDEQVSSGDERVRRGTQGVPLLDRKAWIPAHA